MEKLRKNVIQFCHSFSFFAQSMAVTGVIGEVPDICNGLYSHPYVVAARSATVTFRAGFQGYRLQPAHCETMSLGQSWLCTHP